MFKAYLAYLRDNPEGYWFRAKLFGWGWTPAKWQGFAVVAVAIAVLVLGINISEIDDAPGAAVLGFLLMLGIVFGFGFWKGEKPRWQWKIPDKYKE